MKTYNRLPHILNRNIVNKISTDEINLTFSRKEYSHLRNIERVVFSKFIKEVEIEDIDSILESYDFTKEDIKRLYETSPYRNSLLSKEWDKYFELQSIFKPKKVVRKPSRITMQILAKRGVIPIVDDGVDTTDREIESLNGLIEETKNNPKMADYKKQRYIKFYENKKDELVVK